MRFVFAIICFVIALVGIGTGIAQKTIFLGPDRVVASVSTTSDATVTIIDGATLNTFPRNQRISIGGSPEVFAAYGRTIDVMAWVGKASYNRISYDPTTKELASKTVTGSEQAVPNPANSDLWLADYSDSLSLAMRVKVPTTISFIVVSNGTDPAPANISLSWPLDNATPWAGPLMLGGAVVLVIGFILLLWAIVHVRRSRGPRRKSPKMPKLPKQPRYRPSTPRKALPSSTRGRRSTRSALIAVPLGMAAILALSACTTDPSPNANFASPVPTSTAAALAAEATAGVPSVTALQATRILQRVSDVATAADKKRDATLIATRFAGPALALRLANYKIRAIDSSQAPITAIPKWPVKLVLPAQRDTWPRTVFAIIKHPTDETVPPIAIMLVQNDPRANYKVQYAVNLEPGTVFPNVAPDNIGTPQQSPDTPLLTLAPAKLAAAYGDILKLDTKSAYFTAFDESTDSLRKDVGLAAQKKQAAKLPKTAKLVFSNAPGIGEIIVLSTNDGGAIVAVELDETQTVTPVKAGATVNAPKSVKALSGKSVSSKGLVATYGDQLLFYIPSSTEGGLIKLLGYDQDLVSASELKKK